MVGPVTTLEQHKLRPWATVWRVVADDAVFYAKRNCAAQDFEARLLVELTRLSPARVVPLTGADLQRGWLITPDQGPLFGDRVAHDDLAAWCRLVAEAMQLQRDLTGHADTLVAAGLTVQAPEDAEEYVAERVAVLAALPSDDPRRLGPDEAARVRACLPSVRAWSAEVADLGLPLALQHNDLHEHNAFDTAEGLRFFDFADSLLADPLGALLVPFNVLADRLGAAPNDVRLRRVADAALEVWSDVAPLPALRAAMPAALQLGRLGRVESWHRIAASLPPDALGDVAGAAAAWLGTLSEEPPVRL